MSEFWFIGGPLAGQTIEDPHSNWHLTYTVEAPPVERIDENTLIDFDFGLRHHTYRRALTDDFYYLCYGEDWGYE